MLWKMGPLPHKAALNMSRCLMKQSFGITERGRDRGRETQTVRERDREGGWEEKEREREREMGQLFLAMACSSFERNAMSNVGC